MKRNTAFPQGKNKPIGHFPYDLTIGMITKNDKDSLERCLNSMKPLREALQCQLIITDTGSTDGTRELAQAQADVFLEFDWCDDFSKARNTGVAKAQGRWFFYVDSDHEFDESYQALVDFLQSPQGQDPNIPFASIHIRNYYGSTVQNDLTHKDATSCLLVNFSKGKQEFVGRIHESIPLPDVSVPHVPLLLHHWGYVDAKPQEKSQRNLAILLETIEEDPLDLKQHLQYVKDLISPEICYQHLEKLQDILEKPEAKARGNYPLMSFLCLIFQSSFYLKQHDYGKCEDTLHALQERLQNHAPFQGSVLDLETQGLIYALSLATGNHGTQEEAFTGYQKAFYLLQSSGKHDYAIYYDYQYTAPLHFHKEELAFIQEQIAEGKEESATRFLAQSTAYMAESSQVHPYTESFVSTCLSVGAFSLVEKNLHYLQSNPHAYSYHLFQTAIEKAYHSDNSEMLSPLFMRLGKEPVDSYTALCHYRSKDYQWESCLENMTPLLQADKDYPQHPLFYDLFYGYVKTKQCGKGYLEHLSVEMIPDMVESIQSSHSDFFSLVLDTIQSEDFAINTLKEEQIWSHLGYEVLCLLAKSLEKDSAYQTLSKEILPCFRAITPVMQHYIDTVYNPNILCHGGISVLTMEEIFGFYSSIALEQEKTDSLEYIRGLKESLKSCPKYKSLVYFLIAQGENTVDSPQTPEVSNPHQMELSALAVEVKKNIVAYLQNGNLPIAQALLDKYRNIQPNDPELPSLLARCGMK